MNIPFVAGMSLFVWQNFLMTEQNILESTIALNFIVFRAYNIFRVYLVIVIFIFLIRQKSALALPLFFPKCPYPFPILLLILVLGWHILLLTLVGRLCVSHGGALVIGVSDVPPVLDVRFWWNHPQSPPVFSGIFLLSPLFHFFVSSMRFILFSVIVFFFS